MTNKPDPNCRYFYHDYFRGSETMECRLPKSSDSLRWERSICDTCPVPDLVRETNCPHLALEGTIRKRRPFGTRMDVFAICTKHMVQLKEAGFCAQCADDQAALLDESSVP
ncbi:MAG: hypothetical protein WAZ19_10935 [Anaerolineae bacterium]